MTTRTTEAVRLYTHVYECALGRLGIVVDQDDAVVALSFVDAKGDLDLDHLAKTRGARLVPDRKRCREVASQLDGYFGGERRVFDLPLNAAGTPFQHEVWKALQALPYGATTSYGELAAELGRPGAARAVGRANATNPIPIVVPCHRVVGADGSLTGFGGGIELKRKLIAHERQVLWRDGAMS